MTHVMLCCAVLCCALAVTVDSAATPAALSSSHVKLIISYRLLVLSWWHKHMPALSLTADGCVTAEAGLCDFGLNKQRLNQADCLSGNVKLQRTACAERHLPLMVAARSSLQAVRHSHIKSLEPMAKPSALHVHHTQDTPRLSCTRNDWVPH